MFSNIFQVCLHFLELSKILICLGSFNSTFNSKKQPFWALNPKFRRDISGFALLKHCPFHHQNEDECKLQNNRSYNVTAHVLPVNT